MSQASQKQTCLFVCALVLLAGCPDNDPDRRKPGKVQNENGWKHVSGRIKIDGSSTVYPITQAAVDAYKKRQPRVWIRVDLSGSGRGLKKLCDGEIYLANSSRKIKPKEIEKAHSRGIEIIELQIALDGISVVVNPKNTWVDSLSLAELKRLWEADSRVKRWNDLRPEWPDSLIQPCAPTYESGTWAFFTQAICGEEGNIRKNYFAHEDEHVLAPYVGSHKNSIGFFGYGWYEKYHQKLKLVPVSDGQDKPISPTKKTIQTGQYTPLTRPLFLYVNAHAATRPAVQDFVKFYLDHARKFVRQAGYVPLSRKSYAKMKKRFRRRTPESDRKQQHP